jgi:hypothetical protein
MAHESKTSGFLLVNWLFFGAGDWTQGHGYVRHMLLSYTSPPENKALKSQLYYIIQNHLGRIYQQGENWMKLTWFSPSELWLHICLMEITRTQGHYVVTLIASLLHVISSQVRKKSVYGNGTAPRHTIAIPVNLVSILRQNVCHQAGSGYGTY